MHGEVAKVYLPDNPMLHQDMIEQSILYYASRANSSLQEKKYQELCVDFAGHPSLHSGAATNFLRKWGNSSNNSIIYTGMCDYVMIIYNISTFSYD